MINAAAKPSGQFLNRAEYFINLAKRIAQSTPSEHVLLTTMAFDASDTLVQNIIEQLVQAAKRGIKVQLAVDAYDFIAGEHFMGPLWWHSRLPQNLPAHSLLARNVAALKRIQDAGGTYAIINAPTHPFHSPFTGRSHIKCAVVGNTCFVGGCNLYQHMQLDCMYVWEDDQAANWLLAAIGQLVQQESNQAAFGNIDQSFLCGQGTLLLDAGTPRQSIILENAYKLIDDAQNWLVITSQFYPNSKTAEKLLAAHMRGVKVYLLLNHISQHHNIHAAIQRIVTPYEKLRAPKSFFDFVLPKNQPYLHAKIVASEHEAIIGSHNFIPSGVNFGTAELALLNKTPEFAHSASAAIFKQTPFWDDARLRFLQDTMS